MNESQNTEWKQSWRDEYLQWICAFANTEGGTLYIGVDDSGKVIGVDNAQKLLELIPSKIVDRLGIVAKVNLLQEGGKDYIEIITQAYSNSISCKGKYYRRSGSTTRELNGLELSEFLLQKSGKNWDEVVVEDASIADIDSGSLKALIADSDATGRLPETQGLSDIEVLQKLHVVQGEKIKRSGIVLFAKQPNQFISNCKVMIGRFGEDSEDLKFQEVVEGNLIYILSEVQTQLNHKFLTRPVDFVGMMRQEKDEYPVAALREMLLNALVHKRYGGTAVQLRVFDDRISIWNEGSLPSGLTIESLKTEHNSKPSNPLIADVCFKAGYIDTWGRGTLKIYKACRDAGLPEPQIIEKDGGIEVTLIKTIGLDRHVEHSEGFRSNFGTISEQIRKEFGTNVEATFAIIFDNPNYSAKQIAEELSITSRTVENHQAKLKDAGFIGRVGDNLGGYWQILTK